MELRKRGTVYKVMHALVFKVFLEVLLSRVAKFTKLTQRLGRAVAVGCHTQRDFLILTSSF